jgi:hypothetical protein
MHWTSEAPCEVLPATLGLESELVHWFAIDVAYIYKNLPLSAFPVVLLRIE